MTKDPEHLQRTIACPYCFETGRIGPMSGHIDKCKLNPDRIQTLKSHAMKSRTMSAKVEHDRKLPVTVGDSGSDSGGSVSNSPNHVPIMVDFVSIELQDIPDAG